jgi:hypothetical protein
MRVGKDQMEGIGDSGCRKILKENTGEWTEDKKQD